MVGALRRSGAKSSKPKSTSMGTSASAVSVIENLLQFHQHFIYITLVKNQGWHKAQHILAGANQNQTLLVASVNDVIGGDIKLDAKDETLAAHLLDVRRVERQQAVAEVVTDLSDMLQEGRIVDPPHDDLGGAGHDGVGGKGAAVVAIVNGRGDAIGHQARPHW